MKQVIWSQPVVEEFIKVGNLTELEEKIIRGRALGETRVEQSLKYNISIATCDRVISRLKIKYDEAQRLSPILKERKSGAKELYGTH